MSNSDLLPGLLPQSQNYYAVIFISERTSNAENYSDTAAKMKVLASQQDGYLGMESFSNEAGRHVTISYWRSMDAIEQWKNAREHRKAQQLGKEKWYSNYKVEVCRIIRSYDFSE